MFLLNTVWGRLNCWNWHPETLASLFPQLLTPDISWWQVSFTALQALWILGAQGPGFQVAVGPKWSHGGRILWKCQKKHSKSPFTLELVFYFLSFFFFFLNAYVFICLVALPWFSVAIPRVFDPCAPWGVLDVACGIQSLDQESSEFYFLLE